MLRALILILLFLSFPLNAWAYFDPGFGGYLVSSIISWIMAGIAFASAAVIYFFRTVIGRGFITFWKESQGRRRIFLLAILGILGLLLAAFVCRALYKPSQFNPPFQGARLIDPQRVSKGYNLYDGQLIDNNGQTVKAWSGYIQGIIDRNGDYYGGQTYKEIWGRYTWDDHPVWEKKFLIHHELYLSPQGTVFTFTKETHPYHHLNVDFDIILEFDKNGRELQRFSFWDHLKEFQPYKPQYTIDIEFFSIPAMVVQKYLSKSSYDYFHINSFYIIPPNALEGRNPAFRPGNWLISLLHGSMIFILDQDTKKVLWHALAGDIEGDFEGQHSVSMLPDGNILIFENGYNRKASRIVIIDPLTLKIKWQYSDKDFYTESGGFVQLLPNGNFLITESEKFHAFELTPGKKIVWEYYSPAFNDHTLYRMTRYPQNMIDRFMLKGGS